MKKTAEWYGRIVAAITIEILLFGAVGGFIELARLLF